MQKIVIHYNSNGNLHPVYSSKNASGADLKADIEDTKTVNPGERILIPTGIRMEIPEGYEAQVRSRSGLSINHGIAVLNSPGTIDSDYRGEIKVILVNLSDEPFRINRGDRIAQVVFAPVIQAEFIEKLELQTSERGVGGFGSTGI